MKASDIAKVWMWLEEQQPGATSDDLQEVAERHFGKITWDSQMGYGEGLITCTFPQYNITGSSGGDCTSEEALLDAVAQLLRRTT